MSWFHLYLAVPLHLQKRSSCLGFARHLRHLRHLCMVYVLVWDVLHLEKDNIMFFFYWTVNVPVLITTNLPLPLTTALPALETGVRSEL